MIVGLVLVGVLEVVIRIYVVNEFVCRGSSKLVSWLVWFVLCVMYSVGWFVFIGGFVLW